MMFGSSGHVKRPRGGVANYIRCAKTKGGPNVHIKSIVNTDHVKAEASSPHAFVYHDGYYAVSTDFQQIDGPFNDPATWTGWHVRHYAIKSIEDFERKMKRGAGDASTKAMSFFEDTDAYAQDVCLPLVFR
jgi:hypothetical protein